MTSPTGEKKNNEKNTNIRVLPDENIFITYALIFHFVDGFMLRELWHDHFLVTYSDIY